MNAIASLFVIVFFVVGAAFLSIEAANFGIVFIAAAMILAISGQSGAKVASLREPQALYDVEMSPVAEAARSNIAYLALSDLTAERPVAKFSGDTVLLKKEFGGDFAFVGAGAAIQTQIDALFESAADALASAKAASDAAVLAQISPPYFSNPASAQHA
jgi:hypothetical protein